jgi:hypothetical protein
MRQTSPKTATKPGRTQTKAKGVLFKLKKPLNKFLRDEARKTGKTMVRIVEELLEASIRGERPRKT